MLYLIFFKEAKQKKISYKLRILGFFIKYGFFNKYQFIEATLFIKPWFIKF